MIPRFLMADVNEKHRANTNEHAHNGISRQYDEMINISEKERNNLA